MREQSQGDSAVSNGSFFGGPLSTRHLAAAPDWAARRPQSGPPVTSAHSSTHKVAKLPKPATAPALSPEELRRQKLKQNRDFGFEAPAGSSKAKAAGRSAKAPATGQPKQQAPAATGSAAVGQRLPSTQPDIAAGAPAPAQQRRLQGPQHAPTASGKGQQQAPRTNGSAAGAPPAPPTAPQLFLPQPAQRTAPQQQVGPAHTGPAHTGRPATPPPKKPAPGAASTPTGRTATPPLKKPAPAPEPDYAAAFESAAKAIPLAGKPRRRRTSGSLVGGAGEASHARAASKSKKAAIARKDAVSPQAMGPSARQIADQGMQAALEAFKRTHKTQPRPPKWKGPPGAIPPKGATPKMQPAQGGAGTIKAHQGSAPDRQRSDGQHNLHRADAQRRDGAPTAQQHPSSRPSLQQRVGLKRQRPSPEEEEEEDDDDDFIDDDNAQDWRTMLRSMTGYNPSRFRDTEMDDRSMEASFADMQAEERRSAKLARQADLEEERLEMERQQAKAKRLKQQH